MAFDFDWRAACMDAEQRAIHTQRDLERLRAVADDLANHLRGYVCHCQMSKCKCGYDDVMDAYEAVRGE